MASFCEHTHPGQNAIAAVKKGSAHVIQLSAAPIQSAQFTEQASQLWVGIFSKFPGWQELTQEVPSMRNPDLQEAHSVKEPSTHVKQSLLHPLHVFVTASWVYPGGQLATQVEFSKNEPFGHSVQLLLVVPEHLEQEGSQVSHVLVVTLLKSPGGQFTMQEVPFIKSPFVHVEHSVLLGPVQSAQSP